MDEQGELRLRRKAIQLRLSSLPLKIVLQMVHRSKAWFSKWFNRFDQFGTAGLKSRTRRPHHHPTALTAPRVRAIIRIRQRLARQAVGLIGPRAIQREFERLGGPVPSSDQHQTRLASARPRPLASSAQLFSPAAASLGRRTACDGLDLSLSGRRGQSVCLSHAEPAHPSVCANDGCRQTGRDSDRASASDLANPWNSSLFATRQRCRLLRGLQNAPPYRAGGTPVFVCRHRVDLSACGRTQVQWRSRRIERAVESGLLATTALHLVATRPTHQSAVSSMVCHALRAAHLSGADAHSGPTHRTAEAADIQASAPLADAVTDHRWADPLHSPSASQWHHCHLERNVEGGSTLRGPICLGDPDHPSSSTRHLVSTFGAIQLALDQNRGLSTARTGQTLEPRVRSTGKPMSRFTMSWPFFELSQLWEKGSRCPGP